MLILISKNIHLKIDSLKVRYIPRMLQDQYRTYSPYILLVAYMSGKPGKNVGKEVAKALENKTPPPLPKTSMQPESTIFSTSKHKSQKAQDEPPVFNSNKTPQSIANQINVQHTQITELKASTWKDSTNNTSDLDVLKAMANVSGSHMEP